MRATALSTATAALSSLAYALDVEFGSLAGYIDQHPDGPPDAPGAIRPGYWTQPAWWEDDGHLTAAGYAALVRHIEQGRETRERWGWLTPDGEAVEAQHGDAFTGLGIGSRILWAGPEVEGDDDGA